MTSTPCSPDVPPFHGYVEATVDALRLLYAAQRGYIPRTTRPLNDPEKKYSIKSGAVFIFSVEESGIKQWIDGVSWSPPHIVGKFAVYKEINEGCGQGSNKEIKAMHNSLGLSSQSGGRLRPLGLIKKTITITIDGLDLHLISYYTQEDIRAGRLKMSQRPSSRLDIMKLDMPPNIFRRISFKMPPKVEVGADKTPQLFVKRHTSENGSMSGASITDKRLDPEMWTNNSGRNIDKISTNSGGAASSGPPTIFSGSEAFIVEGGEFNAANGNIKKSTVYNNCVFHVTFQR
ncbi:hypothetical protein GYMLUDRAFT_246378 [Collybiopsis luxurians FD-317 M1]|uniref:Uncharacterized protein n=1 Tax=Collybiopsis luxurians FD-317 M1 TaxID=944289 RepID=A0A0D0BRZ0_9AGAR|nr:hypothetical protein GYMLUDRAFT_246378 [Collybiopsis luxurians FD-317 M1]